MSSVEQAYGQALRYLARREYSRLELGYKLSSRGYADGLVEETLDRLEAEGALDEMRMAEAWCRVRFERGYGPRRIVAELRERGVGPTARGYAYLTTEQERALAVQVLTKRFGETPPEDHRAAAKRKRFLEYRGFSPEICRVVVAWSHPSMDE